MTPAETSAATAQDRNEVLRRALVELRSAKGRLEEIERARNEAIAVVGIGCRLPGGVHGPETYWGALLAGFSGVAVVPPDRWDVDAYYDADPDAPGKMVTRSAGLIEGVDQFDAALFGIPPREVAAMDPQHRIVLEVAWEALEHAGIAPDSLRSVRGGVFVGVTSSDYAHLAVAARSPGAIDAYAASGNAANFVSGRLSYLLGLVGPSMAIDTACSSSLVAVHLACQSLRSGESDLALAGGVNLLLSPETSVALSKARMLSPEGLCKTFDAAADGYVRGEGCGVIVLRRLSDALADGDDVLAVIRGSAVNQDGRSSGLTVPHGPSQEEVIAKALGVAGIAASEVGYVEAHGTGTPLGDPIELRALARALSTPGREHPLVVGSVKTNIGHLESAAGIAGLIKAILTVGRGVIPPHRNFTTPNPHVDFAALGLSVPCEVTPFPAPRVAGVSSFGVSGTNAHVVVAAPPLLDRPSADPPPPGSVVVKVSGRDESARAAVASRLGEHVAAHPEHPLTAVAWGANVGRADLASRAVVTARTHGELAEALSAVAEGRRAANVSVGTAPASNRPRTLFVVPGQGSNAAGALAGLHGSDPVVTAVLDELALTLGPTSELPLRALLVADETSEEALALTEHAQPCLYALAVTLARFYAHHGIVPDVLLGHSVGAYAAAAIAGVMSLGEGARLVAERGRIMARLAPGGQMAAVFAAPEVVTASLGPTVSLAAVNAPGQCVISGAGSEVEAVLARLAAAGITTRRLEVRHGFHSALVEPVLPELAAVLDTVALSPPHTMLFSDTTGERTTEEVATPGYWLRHARETTNFLGALTALGTSGPPDVVIELGPGTTALSLSRQALGDAPAYLASLKADRAPAEQLTRTLAEAWTHGHHLEWRNESRVPSLSVHLPTYPFQRHSYWLPAATPAPVRESPGVLDVVHLPTPSPHTITQTELPVGLAALVDEHKVHGHAVLPGVVYLELLLATASHLETPGEPVISELELQLPYVVTPGERATIHTTLSSEADGTTRAEVHTRTGEGPWRLHATARLTPREEQPLVARLDPAAVIARCGRHFTKEAFYGELWHPEFVLGPSFQLVEEAWCGAGEVIGKVRVAGRTNALVGGGVRPELLTLDAAVQLLLVAAPIGEGERADRPLAIGAGFATFRAERDVTALDGDLLWCRASITSSDQHGLSGDVVVHAADGTRVAEIAGVRFRRVVPETLERLAGPAGRPIGLRRAGDELEGARRLRIELHATDGEEERRSVLGRHVAGRLAAILGCEPDAVDLRQPILDVADSLMLAELKAVLERDLELPVPIDLFFETADLAAVIEWCAAELARGEDGAAPPSASRRVMEVASLSEEAFLPEEITAGGSPRPIGPDGPADVLLTGATGFLGAFVLAELLEQTRAVVHCLVRAESEEEGRARVLANLAAYGLDRTASLSRIAPVIGDLTHPGLGLPADALAELAGSLDAIYHCGAVVNWVYPYTALRPANVDGTREMLRLATMGRPIPFHFVSTVGVFSSAAYASASVSESEPLAASGPLAVGYAQSKWVAEQMVRTAAARGVPTTIHRPSVGSDSRSGAFNPRDHNWLTLRGCVELGGAPRLPLPLQLAPVDFVASAIVRVSLRPEHYGRTFHLVNPTRATWEDLFSAARSYGYALAELPADEWIAALARAVATQRSTELSGLLPFFTDSIREASLPYFDCLETEAALARDGLVCPPLDDALLKRSVDQLVESGFLDPPLATSEPTGAGR